MGSDNMTQWTIGHCLRVMCASVCVAACASSAFGSKEDTLARMWDDATSKTPGLGLEDGQGHSFSVESTEDTVRAPTTTHATWTDQADGPGVTVGSVVKEVPLLLHSVTKGTEDTVRTPIRTPTTTPPTVDFVVAFCNEGQAAADRIRSDAAVVHRNSSAHLHCRVVIYCKCGHHPWCNKTLENVGREAETYLHHVKDQYDALADITVFVNAGLDSPHKTFASVAFFRITRILSHRRTVMEMIRGQAIINKASLRRMFADESIFSSNLPSEQDLPGPLAGSNCAAAVTALCAPTHRCTNTPEMQFPCRIGSSCGCDPALDCTWLGDTKANKKFVTNQGKMRNMVDITTGKQSNISFYQWSCDRMHLTPEAIHECGHTFGAVLAVGADRLQMYPRSFYSALQDEIALYGNTGGVMGHFFERLWRPMFARNCAGLHGDVFDHRSKGLLPS
jgi:hypothetical protein